MLSGSETDLVVLVSVMLLTGLVAPVTPPNTTLPKFTLAGAAEIWPTSST
jgi:hypothetical protein